MLYSSLFFVHAIVFRLLNGHIVDNFIQVFVHNGKIFVKFICVQMFNVYKIEFHGYMFQFCFPSFVTWPKPDCYTQFLVGCLTNASFYLNNFSILLCGKWLKLTTNTWQILLSGIRLTFAHLNFSIIFFHVIYEWVYVWKWKKSSAL